MKAGAKRTADVVALTGNAKYAGGKVLGRYNGMVVFANRDGSGFYISIKPERGAKKWRVYSAQLTPYGLYVRFAPLPPRDASAGRPA